MAKPRRIVIVWIQAVLEAATVVAGLTSGPIVATSAPAAGGAR